jgi:hypothetical protein
MPTQPACARAATRGKGDRAGDEDEEPHTLEFQAAWAENLVRRSWTQTALKHAEIALLFDSACAAGLDS